jgi:hypothetical protein
MFFKKRKIIPSLIALAVLAFSSLVSFHAHADEANSAKTPDHCATCLNGSQFRAADPTVPAAAVVAPLFDHFHVASVVQASFVVRSSGPRPARAPPVS